MNRDVLDRAVEAGKGPWFAAGIDMNHPEADLRYVLAAAVPVIVAAAVKEERERVRDEIAKAAEMEAEITQDYAYPEYGRGVVAGYKAALAAIDKEGEQDAPEDR